MKIYIDNLIDKLRDTAKLKDNLKTKFSIDDKSLRENSGFFESKKKNENSVSLYEGQLKHLKDKVDSYFAKLRQQIHHCKAKFRAADEKAIDFGKQKYKERITEINNYNKNEYD